MKHRSIISEEDRKRIKEAVSEAERKTSGEIVPYFIASSDSYDEATWKASSLFGLAGLSGSVFEVLTGYHPSLDSALFVAISTLGGAILGFLLAFFIPRFRRFFINEKRMERFVQQKAREVFLQEEIFATRGRTGILLFVSEFEHRVTVLGDSGISAKVPQGNWEEIVNVIVQAIRNSRTGDGLVLAIQMCGTLLLESGVEIQKDDINEISNELRIES